MTREFAPLCCPLANRWQCGFCRATSTGPCSQFGAHRLIWTNTRVVKVECVPSPPMPFWLKSVVLLLFVSLAAMSDRDDGVGRRRRQRRLRRWLRHERLSVQIGLAKSRCHSSQRAGLAREKCVRRAQLHVASPGERSGVPQETAPQVWLADPASPGLLARLLAAVLATHKEKDVEQVRKTKEELEKQQEKARKVRQPLRRFVESSIGDLHCSFCQRKALLCYAGGSTTPQNLGALFVPLFFVSFKGSRDRHSHARRRC